MRHFPLSVCAIAISLACAPDQTAPDQPTTAELATSAVSYRAINLGTLGGTRSEALGINSSGHVVGRSTLAGDGPDSDRAFLWRNGVMTNLGRAVGGVSSQAGDINALGVVVGNFVRSDGQTRGFVWHNGSVRKIGTLGGRHTHVTGINKRNEVVGLSSTASGADHAFIWKDGVMRDLGPIGPQNSTANAINNSSQVVGSAGAKPVIWSGGNLKTLPSPNGGSAFGLNNVGGIVGYIWIPVDEFEVLQHAARWQNGTLRDLGTLGGQESEAHDINGDGVIVGQASNTSGAPRPVVWRDGRIADLGTLGGKVGEATAINGTGWIVGMSTTASGQRRATLWRPQ